MSEIGYFLARVRTEIRQAQRAAKPEAAIAHFQLAEAYLQRIHDLSVLPPGQHGQALGESAARE